MVNQQREQKDRIAEGVGARALLKMRTPQSGGQMLFIPVGKSIQMSAINTWKQWVNSNTLPSFWVGLDKQDELDWSRYPYCQEHNLHDSSCFFGAWTDDEELETGSTHSPYPNLLAEKFHGSTDVATKAFDRLSQFREHALTETNILPADDYLRSFAYIMHNSFHLQPSMLEVYKNTVGERNPGLGDLKVSLHIRRADSCSSNEYRNTPSSLDDRAQMTNVRQCYNNSVYVDALRRMKELYKRPLTIYLSSDDSQNILGEIEKEHPDIYATSTWRFLDYPRDKFKYDGTIEGWTNTNKAFMSETAVQDLWHMSHGEAFVGHMGSRFGKVGYLLAVSRQNTALPYVSVDGHNLCCEVDEQCSRATQYIDNMVDCLTFSHELVSVPINKDYWEAGSTVREVVKQQR
jgi:hypothetical protein